MANKKGDKTEPCLTPNFTANVYESTQSHFTIEEQFFLLQDTLNDFNSPFAHHNSFSRMHMGVRNDPSLGPVFSDSFSSTKKTENSRS